MLPPSLLLLLLSALVENGAGTGWTVWDMLYLFIVLFVLTIDIKTLLDAGKSSNLMVRSWILAVFQYYHLNELALPTLQICSLSLEEKQSDIFRDSVTYAYFVLAVIKSMTRGQSAWACKTKNLAGSSETKRREFCSRKIVNKKNTNIEFEQWLVGVTDGVGRFSFGQHKNGSWFFYFKIVQSTYNLRLLYHCKSKLELGSVKRLSSCEAQAEKGINNNAFYIIKDLNQIISKLFPIFDTYPLITKKHYDYVLFKKAVLIFNNKELTIEKKQTLLNELKKESMPENYISPYWFINNYNVKSLYTARLRSCTVINKSWLIGFLEVNGNFIIYKRPNQQKRLSNSSLLSEHRKPSCCYASTSTSIAECCASSIASERDTFLSYNKNNKSVTDSSYFNDQFVHAFEISHVSDKFVLDAICYSLSLPINKNRISTTKNIITTNANLIPNIILYLNETMKGFKSLEFSLWARSFNKNKSGIKKYNYLAKVQKLNYKINRSLQTRNFTTYTQASSTNLSNKTSLVVWGTNLASNVGYPKFGKVISSNIQLPFYIKAVIYGLLLSDGWLSIASKTHKNARVGFAQSLAHFDYLFQVFQILSPYCSSYPLLRIRKRKDTVNYGLQFYTRSLPCFTELHSTWIKDGKKIIPIDLFDYLTPLALSIWIMGDGSHRSHGLVICTDSFSLKEVIYLINVLIIKYELICKLREHNKGQYRIYISEKSLPKLRSIVGPYIISSMLYKISKLS